MTSEAISAPYLVALDTKTGYMRRYGRRAGGKAAELDIAEFTEWDMVRHQQQGHVMESVQQFRKYGSKVFT